MKLHKWLLILCALLVLALPCLAQAEQSAEPITVDPSAHIYQQGGFARPHLVSRASGVAAARKALYNALVNLDDEIDMSPYNLTPNELYDLYCDVVNDNSSLFYANYYRYYYDDNNIVGLVLLKYIATGSELARMINQYNAELDRIVAYASAASTPLLKAMMVNDYFCINYQYDESLSIHDAYTLFTQKTGVCQAYMQGYKAALQRLGINVKTATSAAMNHTWNLVQIDGQWYHVDVTWNDPVPDRAGRAGHLFFLRSDEGLERHYDWVPNDGIVCTSTKYDDAIWRRISTPALIQQDKLYLITGEKCSFNLTRWCDDVITNLYNYTAKWYITDGGENDGHYYSGNYSGLGLDQNHLLFNTYQDVYAYSLLDGTVTKLYTVPEKRLGIWASSYSGSKLTASLGTNSGTITRTEVIDLSVPASKSVTIPADTTSIAAGAFENTAVEHVFGGTSLRTINSRAFANCSRLTTIELSAKVSKIAEDAFTGCSSSLVFICPADSYAAGYAAAHGFAVQAN